MVEVIALDAEGLGDRSYLAVAGDDAVVVDPQRDLDRILDLVEARSLRVRLVVETHVHNDYVSGGLALARLTGAPYGLDAGWRAAFDHLQLVPGRSLDAGALQVDVLATPGHTPDHLAFLVRGDGGAALFTGGSMLYGTVGRTDLVAADLTEALTRAQHRSVRHLAELDPELPVHPTHGFGSFCSSSAGADRAEGRIADELGDNPAVRIDDEDRFVAELLAGLRAHPPYYAHMAPLNLAGAFPPDLTDAPAATPEELVARIRRGEWVVDVRPRRDFAAGHLPGSVNVELDGDALPTYVGWTLPWGTPISLVGEHPEQVRAAQRQLVRIGIDRPMRSLVGAARALAAFAPTAAYRVADFDELAVARAGRRDGVAVVDVRRPDEWAAGHLAGAHHVPLEQVVARGAGLPGRQLWVHCATGLRAAVAASLLARAGRDVVLVDDDVEHALPG